MRILLSGDEYNVLNLIASRTKMDCWFYIAVTPSGGDCVFDIENRQHMSLRRGILMLNEGIVPELLNLTDEEIMVYSNLLQELDIDKNPFEEYIQTTIEVYDGTANGICTDSEDSDDI